MRSILFLVIIVVLSGINTATAKPSGARAIVGYWETIDDETQQPKSIVRIYRASDGLYYGRIEELLNPEPGREDPECEKCKGKYSHYKTSDGKVIGTIILRGLEYNSDNKKWENGTIFDPKKGKEYRCEVWLDDSVLRLRGIHWTGLSRTQNWNTIEK